MGAKNSCGFLLLGFTLAQAIFMRFLPHFVVNRTPTCGACNEKGQATFADCIANFIFVASALKSLTIISLQLKHRL